MRNFSQCDQCGRTLGKSYGLDFLGRSYCRRWRCKAKIRLKEKLFRFSVKFKAWAESL